MTDLRTADRMLRNGYPSDAALGQFPFGRYLKKLSETDYRTHGPSVLEAMNILLSQEPQRIVRGNVEDALAEKLLVACRDVLVSGFPGSRPQEVHAFFRVAVLYHDIGKYIIKDRHPSLGWHIIQYLDSREKERLRNLLPNETFFQLLTILVRDHDQFGVLNTGEASYPILLRAARSMGDTPQDRKRILSALMLFNLADMAGSFAIDSESIERVIDDWRWMVAAVEHCYTTTTRLQDYVVEMSSGVAYTYQRIQRLLAESSRRWSVRRQEVDDSRFIKSELDAVFGSYTALQGFASQFTQICKMDYGLRFFRALVEYCEGPREPADEDILPIGAWAESRVSREDVLYSVIAILQRITASYSGMMGDRTHANLIGVELKELTPERAPEKTAKIIELIVKSHYPGLAWMMNDVPAWQF